jgi:uncharacterized LabA/DUF88 family protein
LNEQNNILLLQQNQIEQLRQYLYNTSAYLSQQQHQQQQQQQQQQTQAQANGFSK